MTGGGPIYLLLLMAAALLAAAVVPGTTRQGALTRSLRGWLKSLHSDWSPGHLLLILALTATGLTAMFAVLVWNPLRGAVLGFGCAPVVVWLVLQRGQARYRTAFRRQFLPAVEIIVRGLRSGMPLISALQVVQKEIDGPVRIEFRRLLDDLALGLSLSEAVERVTDRVPLTEVQFFAAAIAFQARTGGRLSEALENLAGTLRARTQLDQRIRTVSQEARTSAVIIGVLPVFVALGLFLLSPEYISLLFADPMGQAVLIGAGAWMLCGIWIMRRMTVIDV